MRSKARSDIFGALSQACITRRRTSILTDISECSAGDGRAATWKKVSVSMLCLPIQKGSRLPTGRSSGRGRNVLLNIQFPEVASLLWEMYSALPDDKRGE